MKILEKDIRYYLDMIRERRPFAFVGYSDAEWICMFGQRSECHSALGQKLDAGHGERLLEVLKRRQNDPWWMLAVPKILQTAEHFDWAMFCDYLKEHDLEELIAYERDMVTDDMAAAGKLYPLVEAIRTFDGPRVMIGNHRLRHMKGPLKLSAFFGIDSPNFHMKPGGIERVVSLVKDRVFLQPALFLVSAGVSAAVIVDQLYDTFDKSIFFDCGSIWDAFVGIGGQREWRAKLYEDSVALQSWKIKCLGGY